jgi:Phytanoyl-CoA dioxygenase (PhyH)
VAPTAFELLDSSEIRGSRPALRARIGKDGYLFFKRLLDEDQIRSAGQAICALLRRHRVADDRYPPGPCGSAPEVGSRHYWQMYREIQSLEAVHRIAFDPPLVGMMRTLVSDAAYCHPDRIIRQVWPARWNGPKSINVHFDYPTWGIVDMFTTWIPFTDIPRERGGLYVLKGSQKRPSIPCAPLDEANSDWVSAEYEVGDVLVFHCYTLHAAPPNRSDAIRISADFRWHDSSRGTPSWVLTPDANVGTWEELTADWTSRDWVAHPPNVVHEQEEGLITAGFPKSSFIEQMSMSIETEP